MIFGIDEAFRMFGTDDLREQWTDWMVGKHLLFGDEIGASKRDDRNRIEDNLKIWITSRKFRLRRMHRDPEMADNNFNIIIATNKDNPIQLVDTDRRWTFFTPGQSHEPTPEERKQGIRPWHLRANPAWKALGIASEIEGRERVQEEAPYLALYLLLLEPDQEMLMNVIQTEARKKMIEEQRDRFVDFAYRVYNKDADWFEDNADPDNAKIKALGDVIDKTIVLDRIRTAVKDLANDLRSGKDYVVVDEAYLVFNAINTDGHTTKNQLNTNLTRTGVLKSERTYVERDGGRKQVRVYRIVPGAL